MRLAAKYPGSVALSSDPFVLGEDTQKPTAPSEFRIFKAGLNTSDRGNFVFDKLAAELVMAAFAKKDQTLTIDYEHMAAQDPPVIAPAAASSWVPEVRNGELWATNVNWTVRARGLIEAREYTRFSPLFYSDPKSKRITKVINCALTNVEALDGIDTLVAATAMSQGDTTMKKFACKTCTKALKAPTDDSDGDEVMCTACGAAPKMLSAIGLRVDASGAEALTALSALTTFRESVYDLTGKTNPTEAVQVLLSWKGKEAEVTALRTADAKRESDRLRGEFDAVFADAVTAGKIAPADLEAKKTALSAPFLKVNGGQITGEIVTALKAIVGDMGAKVSTEATRQSKTGGGPVALTDDDRRAAKMLGHSDEQALSYKKLALESAGISAGGAA